MKNFVYITFSFFVFSSALAHHLVDEVTSNKKIIISWDYDQKIINGRVLTYKLNSKHPELSKEVVGEHILPKIGDKVKIFRTKVKISSLSGKRIESLEKNPIGTATIVSPDLLGDSREVPVRVSGKNERADFRNMPYEKEDIDVIRANSLVAIPDGNIQVEKFDSVEF